MREGTECEKIGERRAGKGNEERVIGVEGGL